MKLIKVLEAANGMSKVNVFKSCRDLGMSFKNLMMLAWPCLIKFSLFEGLLTTFRFLESAW